MFAIYASGSLFRWQPNILFPFETCQCITKEPKAVGRIPFNGYMGSNILSGFDLS